MARGRSGQGMLATVPAAVAGQQSIVSQVALQYTVPIMQQQQRQQSCHHLHLHH